MNGVFDMGGMHGFGSIPIEYNEPVFHSQWEARAMGVTVAAGANGFWTLDASRHARETLPAADYLAFTYYERWLAGLAQLLVTHGGVTVEELSGEAVVERVREPGLVREGVEAAVARGGPVDRQIAAPPGFAVGDRVCTANLHVRGHCRLPGYARGKPAVVTAHHGAHVFPDSNAHGLGEDPRHLYTIRIEGADLWGQSAHARDAVCLDVWEPYLLG